MKNKTILTIPQLKAKHQGGFKKDFYRDCYYAGLLTLDECARLNSELRVKLAIIKSKTYCERFDDFMGNPMQELEQIKI